MPQQAGVVPMPTGSHYVVPGIHQGLVLRYIERAASAAKPLYWYSLLILFMLYSVYVRV